MIVQRGIDGREGFDDPGIDLVGVAPTIDSPYVRPSHPAGMDEIDLLELLHRPVDAHMRDVEKSGNFSLAHQDVFLDQESYDFELQRGIQ